MTSRLDVIEYQGIFAGNTPDRNVPDLVAVARAARALVDRRESVNYMGVSEAPHPYWLDVERALAPLLAEETT